LKVPKWAALRVNKLSMVMNKTWLMMNTWRLMIVVNMKRMLSNKKLTEALLNRNLTSKM
jgi:hypothetical protein